MSDEHFSSLDQARDALAPFFRGTEKSYDAYQQGPYDENYRRFHDEWEAHYRRMRAAILHTLWRHSETKKPRSEMNLAIVGPGFDLANRDLDPLLIETGIARVRRVVLVDFSLAALRASIKSLLRAGVKRTRLDAIQYDLTAGLSTVYERFIQEQLRDVTDEESLSRVLEELAQMDIVGELEERLVYELGRPQSGDEVFAYDELPPDVPENRERSLRLTSGGQPIPLDVVTLNMVLAGTGAAAEAQFWEVYESATRTTDTGGKSARHEEASASESAAAKLAGLPERKPPSDAVVAGRMQILRRFHKALAAYYTRTATNMIMQIIAANPDTTILSTTDISTTFLDEAFQDLGALPRLDVAKMKRELAGAGIALNDQTPVSPWEWHDEDDHCHQVHALTAKKAGASDAVEDDEDAEDVS